MSFEPEDKCEIVTLDNDTAYREFSKGNPSGLLMVPEPYGEPARLGMKSDAGDFAKWLRETAPALGVEIGKADRRIVHRSSDLWLPLVFLAHDLALPVYLNLVASYLYERLKGALRGDRARVRLSAVYQDAKTGVVRRFTFEGDSDALQKALRRLDLDEFYHK